MALIHLLGTDGCSILEWKGNIAASLKDASLLFSPPFQELSQKNLVKRGPPLSY